MARTRLIHPEAPVDDDVVVMSLAARYVWAYLPCHADREGRLADKPLALKAAILPSDTVDMVAILDELAKANLIARYVVNGKRCIQIRNFSGWQKPHLREAPSELPAPSEGTPKANLGVPQETLGTPRWPVSVSDPDPVSDRDSASLRACAPDPSDMAPLALWTSHDWLSLFKRLWSTKYNALTYGNGLEDAKATGDLGDMLAGLPDAERLDAQGRASAMISEYLADAAPGRVKASHPWKWFVSAFTSLRVPPALRQVKQPGATGPPAKPDPYCEFHHQQGSRGKPSFRPLAGCPECKHVTARKGTRDSAPKTAAEILAGERPP